MRYRPCLILQPEPDLRATARRPAPASCWSTSARPRRRRAAAVRPYLKEFLSDPRVVEIPRAALVADPERHHPQHPAEEVGGEIRRRSGPRTARRCKVHTEAPGQAAARLSRRNASASPLGGRLRHALRQAVDRRGARAG